VLANIHAAFAETAAKLWAYARCLGPGRRPGTGMLVGMLAVLVSACPALSCLPDVLPGYVAMTSQSEGQREKGEEGEEE
jgi:telomerase reverse transcriptase